MRRDTRDALLERARRLNRLQRAADRAIPRAFTTAVQRTGDRPATSIRILRNGEWVLPQEEDDA